MKITKKLLLLVLVFFLALSSVCLATDEPMAISNDDGELEDDTGLQIANIINNDIYTFDEDIVIEDVVNGNVFAFGSNVTIKGEIIGDLFVFANDLTIEDTAIIYNNVFAFASNITIKGIVSRDVYAFAQNFELTSGGYIYRDVKLYVGTANINGIIGKNADLIADTITIPEDAKDLIGGYLHYTSTQASNIPEDAVMGEVQYTEYHVDVKTTGEIISDYIVKFFTTILYAVVVILLATFYAPKFVEKTNYTLMKRPFVSAGIGILAFVLVPVVAIILLMTGVLSYVSLAVLAIYALVLSITLPIFSMAIAKSIEKKLKNPSKGKFILFSILSAIVLWLLQIIPYVGTYVSLFIYVVGLGVALFAFFIRKDVSELGAKKE